VSRQNCDRNLTIQTYSSWCCCSILCAFWANSRYSYDNRIAYKRFYFYDAVHNWRI